MAGIWGQSRTQVLDANDNLIPGALAYFFEAATSTPMTVYSSVTLGEVNEHPHPVVADGNARWPNVIFDDEAFSFYRVRVTDAGGSLIYDDDSVPIIGQAESGGGGPPPVPVNPDTLARTGDVKVRFGLAAESGWVRMNGGTIGSSGSGATERANADTQALFEHLWNNANNTICPIAAGGTRGANAAADYTAGKAITLPDMRGRASFGIDAMGAGISSGRIAATYMDTGGVNEVGASGGDDAIVLTDANQIPAHSHDTTGVPAGPGGTPAAKPAIAVSPATHTHLLLADGTSTGVQPTPTNRINQSYTGGGENSYGLTGSTTATATLALSAPSATLTITGNTGNNVTTGVGHENMPPFMLLVYFIKL